MTAAPTPTRTSSARSRQPAGTLPADTKAERTGARPRASTIALAALVLVLGLLWLSLLFVEFRAGVEVDGTWVFSDPAWGIDLQAYLGAAERILKTGSPYAPELVTGAFQPGPAELYYYAPPLSLVLTPLVGLSFADSSALWWALHVLALLAACALMPVSLLLRAAAFAVVAFSLPGLKDPIIGNVSLLLLLPMVVAWRWMDRPIGSLAMALAISVRPSLGLFFFWQLLRRRWQAAVWTAAGGVMLVLVALPFVGLDGHLDYVAVLRNLGVPSGASENRDLGSLLASLGAGDWAATAGRILGFAVAMAAIILALRRDREVSYMVMLSASLLVLPLLWGHYLATLIVPAAFLAQRLWAPLLLLPLLSWLPIGAPLLVLVTMGLTFLVRNDSGATRPTVARVTA